VNFRRGIGLSTPVAAGHSSAVHREGVFLHLKASWRGLEGLHESCNLQ
jgi:hypothetical protein